jgi:hypothetical protein
MAIRRDCAVRDFLSFALLLTVGTAVTGSARAARPNESREIADLVVVGPVTAVYVQDTEGYLNYIVEMRLEQTVRGDGLRKGDTFRAYCYKRKPGKGGIQFDSAGHNAVPEVGQRIKAFVKSGRGRHEGVYPDWFDVLPPATR